MDVTRRDFIRISGAATAGLMLGSLFDLKPIKAYALANPPQWDQVTTSICCYCGVGCGILVGTSSSDPDTVYVQGDPDHPINRGALCSKGQGMAQLRTVNGVLNPRRLTGIKYRAPGAADWDQDGFGDKLYGWDDEITTSVGSMTVLDAIAQLIHDTRDGSNLGYSGNDKNSSPENTTLTDDIFYNTGTVSVTKDSPNVTGVDTKWNEWSGKVQAGDKFQIEGSLVEYEVFSVTDDTHLTLTANYGEPGGSGLEYEIRTTIPVNRCTGIACLGGAAHDTEECYLLVKLMRALGLVFIEHQARI